MEGCPQGGEHHWVSDGDGDGGIVCSKRGDRT